MAKTRTVPTQGMQPGRFRPLPMNMLPERPRLSATLGELMLAKQMARASAQHLDEDD